MEPLQCNPLNSKYSSRTIRPLRRQRGSSDCIVKSPPCSSVNASLEHEPSIDFPASPADSGIEIVTFRSEPSEAVLALRHYAAQDLAMCRETIVILELTRMRKSRIGMRNWIIFWIQIYDSCLAQKIIGVVGAVYLEIDRLFRRTAQQMCHITYNIGKRMAQIRTAHEAKTIWHQMEQQIIRYREMRRSCAQLIFDRLRCNLEGIPVDVPNELFDDLKRGIFSLDRFGDYHPGDPKAEEWDRRANRETHAEAYIRQQPDLPTRPGFNSEFQTALQAASAGFDEFNTEER
ncbi:hypothetical protein PRK78_003872 [Emydomyces testavorans]|uniref:Uncharacterized protein n=1 Tax=Emydomyces testavorans TaxID=2070801 RepID=A0AAF0DGT6_9EURO|nr:hypothetical protein PRK78_003872 [Emydomyces testavorans]